MSRQQINPRKVALPTSAVLLARLDITTAPSIPIKAHKVTSMVLFICVSNPPSLARAAVDSPQKSKSNFAEENANSMIMINKTSGRILSTVPTRLIIVA